MIEYIDTFHTTIYSVNLCMRLRVIVTWCLFHLVYHLTCSSSGQGEALINITTQLTNIHIYTHTCICMPHVVTLLSLSLSPSRWHEVLVLVSFSTLNTTSQFTHHQVKTFYRRWPLFFFLTLLVVVFVPLFSMKIIISSLLCWLSFIHEKKRERLSYNYTFSEWEGVAYKYSNADWVEKKIQKMLATTWSEMTMM